ncbi:MAG TPA: ABC transporter permease [Ignavibacteriaceae bacterium]
MKKDFYKAVLKRIASSVLVLFLLVTFIFILVRLAPGDPTQKFLSPQLSPQLAEKVTKSFGLDQPIYIQYYSFILNIFSGDFGISYNYRKPVFTVVKDYFLFTLIFSTISFIIQLMLGYLLAKYSFNRQGKLIDKIFSKLSIILFSVPTFVLGLILVYIFSVKLDFFPTSGIKSIYNDDLSALGKLEDYFAHLILPMITLSLAGVAVFYKYLRDNLESVKNSAFIVNLRANGFSEKEIFKKHLIPNAIQPLISIGGVEFGILLGGALLTEVIFSLPGMGRLTVSAILNRDFPLVIACSFIAGLMMILSNLAADLIKIKMDKRFIKDLIN